jgi:hypothetical protein
VLAEALTDPGRAGLRGEVWIVRHGAHYRIAETRCEHARPTVPPAVCSDTSPVPTEYIEFKDRPHMLMATEGWQEVATGIEEWLNKQ